EQISEINGRSRLRKVHYDIADFILGFELARGIDRQILALHIDLAAGNGYVSSPENVRELCERCVVSREPLLRINQIDLLIKQTLSFDFRNLRYSLERLCDQIGKLV